MDSESQIPRITTSKEEQVVIPLALRLGKTPFVTPPDDLVQLVTKDVEPIEVIEEILVKRS